ncbi:hypothetical protein C4578_03005 [Candidatus Microgenomates bacterium]|jgi:hypothetical protein|nr:MAG: hypothetical protein C4578_03005 [Candidatus Microgenomates bacterium]
MFFKKFFALIVTLSLLFSAFTPAVFAATETEISGNGSFSTNTVDIVESENKVVVQNNDAVIENIINSEAISGKNNVGDNTGGDVSLFTGNAITSVEVSNLANLNQASIEDCDGCPSDETAKISGNGSMSDNDITKFSCTDIAVFQDNFADFNNDVNAKAVSGYNDANGNTGGDVTVSTGAAGASIVIDNTANANIATVGGDENGEETGAVEATIAGNGSYSLNNISLFENRLVSIVQENLALITNQANAEAVSGKNDVFDNTGGSVFVDTGTALADVEINNLANFNWADVECCLTQEATEISGNGSVSSNNVFLDEIDSLFLFQNEGENEGGWLQFSNWVDAYPKSGYNDAFRNTGSVQSDPTLFTGMAVSEVDVENTGGLNVFGDFPELDFEFNLGQVWGLLF